MTSSFLSIEFGEMELSPFTYYSVIVIAIVFVLCFVLSSIPLARNLNKNNHNKN